MSAGYEFEFGLGVDLGYLYFEDENVGSHVFGVLIVYDLEYAIY